MVASLSELQILTVSEENRKYLYEKWEKFKATPNQTKLFK
jgi:hypothetical protein